MERTASRWWRSARGVVLALGIGCAGTVVRAQDVIRANPPLVVETTQVDAIAGAPILVPLQPIAGRRGAPAVRASAPGVGELACVHRVIEARAFAGRPADAGSVVGRMQRWLGDPGVWTSSIASGEGGRRGVATASDNARSIAILSLPESIASQATQGGGTLPATMTVAEDVLSVRWIASAEQLMAQDKRLRPGNPESPWRATLPEAAPLDEVLKSVLSREAMNPWRRWRVRLVLDGLTPEGTATSRELAPEFDDPAIEAIARWQDARVQALIARLALADIELCRRVCVRLGRIGEVAPEVWVPAWDPDLGVLEDLWTRVLGRAGLDDVQVQSAGQAWLDAQPRGAAWMHDDAGVLAKAWVQGEGGKGDGGEVLARTLPTIAIMNLGDQRTLAWVRTQEHLASGGAKDDADAETDLHAVDAGRTVLIVATQLGEEERAALELGGARGRGEEETLRTLKLGVHAGTWSTTMQTLGGLVPIRPPGLVTGRWHRDLDARAWLTSSSGVDDEQSPCAAMVTRGARVGDATPVWEIYVECAVLPVEQAPTEEGDAVVVYVGPMGGASRAMRVTPDGSVTDLEGTALPEGTALVAREPGRWTARVRLPSLAIDKDGVLRVGLCRLGPDGTRWCWPRATPPWQVEPSRTPIDTAAWER